MMFEQNFGLRYTSGRKEIMKIPTTTPEPGFYYHYKHDSAGSVSNFAYEVLGTGCHTEDDCRPEDANLVVYRPLYESSDTKLENYSTFARLKCLWKT
jgi:hypothetical protein